MEFSVAKEPVEPVLGSDRAENAPSVAASLREDTIKGIASLNDNQ